MYTEMYIFMNIEYVLIVELDRMNFQMVWYIFSDGTMNTQCIRCYKWCIDAQIFSKFLHKQLLSFCHCSHIKIEMRKKSFFLYYLSNLYFSVVIVYKNKYIYNLHLFYFQIFIVYSYFDFVVEPWAHNLTFYIFENIEDQDARYFFSFLMNKHWKIWWA